MDANFTPRQSLQDIKKGIFENKTVKELEVICSVMWQIWTHRNNVIWNKKFQTSSIAVNSANTLLFYWQRAQTKQARFSCLNDREGTLVWRKPDPRWLSCNVDAAVFEGSGKSSFGCLLRDDQERFVAGYEGCLIGIVNSQHAESLDFKESSSWLKKMRMSQVHIELDSLAVVQAFDSKRTNSSFLGSIIDDCFSIVKDLGPIQFILLDVQRTQRLIL